MKELLEITQILEKNKPEKIEVFDYQSFRQSGSKFHTFFDALRKGRLTSDHDAAAYLYDSTPADDRYRQLKSRFRRRLLNTFFFLDTQHPKGRDLEAARNFCHRNISLVRLLMRHGAHMNAAAEAHQVQQTALKFRFAELVVESAVLLREIYASQGDEKSYQKQQDLLQQYYPIRDAEIYAEGALQKIRLIFHANQHPGQELIKAVAASCDNMLQQAEAVDSPLLSLYAYEAWFLRFELEGDYQSVNETGQQAEFFLQRNAFENSKDKLLFFSLGRLRAALHQKDFRSGRAIAENAFRLLTPRQSERLDFMELYLLLSIHSDSILHAFAVYKEAVEHKSFQKLTEEQNAKWQILTAYIYLLMEIRPVSQQFVLSQKKKLFRIDAFLAEPVPYLPHKENQTALIAVAQIAFLLHNKNITEASQMIEWLYTLSKTWKRKDSYIRPYIFIKLLYQLYLSEYQPSHTRKSEALLQELRANPMQYRGHIHHLEVIPYEKLWDMIIGMFK